MSFGVLSKYSIFQDDVRVCTSLIDRPLHFLCLFYSKMDSVDNQDVHHFRTSPDHPGVWKDQSGSEMLAFRTKALPRVVQQKPAECLPSAVRSFPENLRSDLAWCSSMLKERVAEHMKRFAENGILHGPTRNWQIFCFWHVWAKGARGIVARGGHVADNDLCLIFWVGFFESLFLWCFFSKCVFP